MATARNYTPFTHVFANHSLAETIGTEKERRDVPGGLARYKSSFDEVLHALYRSDRDYFRGLTGHTLLGLKLNFRIPSSSAIFFCFALSNRVGSSSTSGVGCLKFSTLAVKLGSRLPSATESLRPSSGLSVADLKEASSAVFPAVVPHVTRERSTVTIDSNACLLSWASERPIPEVSMDPGTDKAVVVSEGGMCEFWPFEGGFVA
jgi:hypothetical protein